jgi:hypothetical protein
MGMLTDRHTAKRKPKKKGKKKPNNKTTGRKKICLFVHWAMGIRPSRRVRERERESASSQRELPRLLASGTRPFSVVTTVNTIDDETTLTEHVIKDLRTVKLITALHWALG